MWSGGCECSGELIDISLKIFVQQLLHPEFNQVFLQYWIMQGRKYVSFYESLPKSGIGNTNSLMSIDSCVFRSGVDFSEKSSGLRISFYILQLKTRLMF